MRRAKRFFSLRNHERRLLLRALWRLSTTCCKLHLLPQKQWRALLAPAHARGTTTPRQYSEAEIAWAVHAAARYVPLANCLPQAIVTKQLMEEQGYQPVLRIGVRPPEELSLKAHAWVEAGGRIVLGEDGSEYQTLVPGGHAH